MATIDQIPRFFNLAGLWDFSSGIIFRQFFHFFSMNYNQKNFVHILKITLKYMTFGHYL